MSGSVSEIFMNWCRPPPEAAPFFVRGDSGFIDWLSHSLELQFAQTVVHGHWVGVFPRRVRYRPVVRG